MEKINAVITGVGGYVPDYILTNDEISKMVDTTDEWIMGRIGIKERRILHEEGLGTSYMARKAAKQLMQRTNSQPDEIDLVIVATTTPDYRLPSTASILCERLGLKRAFAFDVQAVCSGFLYALETGANFIRSGNYKKIIVVGAEKMSSIINYTDRATCPIFGDGAAAFMLEPTTEDLGVMDSVLRTDGKGLPFLHIKAGGSVCTPSYYTLENHMHYIYQEGRTVFKYAVANMANACQAGRGVLVHQHERYRRAGHEALQRRDLRHGLHLPRPARSRVQVPPARERVPPADRARSHRERRAAAAGAEILDLRQVGRRLF